MVVVHVGLQQARDDFDHNVVWQKFFLGKTSGPGCSKGGQRHLLDKSLYGG